MNMDHEKQTQNNKDTSATRAMHKQAKQTAESRARGMASRYPGAGPADMIPGQVSDTLKPAWDEVMAVFNRITSGGRHILAGIQPDPKTKEGKEVVDPKYSKVQGKAFIKGKGDKGKIAMNDVNQGYLGDCYFIASLAALARSNPDAIKQGIRDHGDGTYTVKFPGEKAEVIVDDAFPLKNGRPIYAEGGDKSGRDVELWVMLYEKAWAKLKGGYEQIQGGNIKMQSKDAMQAITGKSTTQFTTSSKSKTWVFNTISKAVTKGLAITAGTYDDKHFDASTLKEMEKKGVHGDHAYAVRGVDPAGKKIKLYNPWGANYPVDDLTIDEFMKYYQVVNINKK